jgi:uncharacterized membrane protein
MPLTRKRLLSVWETARTSYWLVPGAMTAGSAALAYAAIRLDRRVTASLPDLWFLVRSVEEARAVLSTIASSMVTVTGLVFSLTVVVLTLASQQFGPRLLRGFRSDPVMKLVLGTFVATYVYCLLTLAAVGGDVDDPFVPRLAVALGLLLALLSVGVLIFFIHHLASEIQAESILANVAGEVEAVVDRLFPESGAPAPPELPQPDFAAAAKVRSRHDGYVQVVDDDTLLKLATDRDAVIRLERRPGDFVVAGEALASVVPARMADELAEEVAASFVLGRHRTPPQDAEFGLSQLVEVGVRALSPGINDPYTAVACIDRLTQALARLARRPEPAGQRGDAAGCIRLVAEPQSFASLAAAVFDPLRQHALAEPMVVARLLRGVEVVAGCTDDAGRLGVLRALALGRAAEASGGDERDRAALGAAYQRAVAATAPPRSIDAPPAPREHPATRGDGEPVG